MHSPLRIQLHQLAHVKAELDIGDGAAGISLAASTGAWWHQEPGDKGQSLTPACHSPSKAVAHGYSLEMLDDE